MKRTILPIATIALLAACDRASTYQDEKEAADERREAAMSEPDNTKKNVRDVDPDLDTKTPFDQGENEADREISASIRKAVVGDASLSFGAKNVKIITKDGVVTLRGPVGSESEKSSIYAVAQRTQGVKRVENQLEVTADRAEEK